MRISEEETLILCLKDQRALPIRHINIETKIPSRRARALLAGLQANKYVLSQEHNRTVYYLLSDSGLGYARSLLEEHAHFTITSETPGTDFYRLRSCRKCYGHLAGKWGVMLMQQFIKHGFIKGGNGKFEYQNAVADRLSAPGKDIRYELTQKGITFLSSLGLNSGYLSKNSVRYCVDFTEQNHHIAGRLGGDLLKYFLREGWLMGGVGRTLNVTDYGKLCFAEYFNIACLL